MAHFKVQAEPVMAAPNVIPMCDIMLVLLIIFMVVTPLLQKGMQVNMARAQNAVDMPKANRDDAVIVAVTRDGSIYLGNNRSSLGQISSQVSDLIANRVDKTIFIKCDRRAKYGDVVKLVDEVRSAGVDNVGLLTEHVETAPPPPPPPLTNTANPGGTGN